MGGGAGAVGARRPLPTAAPRSSKRAGSWRSQESARFEDLGACRAGGPDATPTLRCGASVPHHASSVPSAPAPALSRPGRKRLRGGWWVGRTSRSPART
eukprot:1624533-Pleurochrysis_carterae.AAC.1